ncbi:MAG: small subunit ribosomal protein S3 [Fusobacteria bacterium]|nr:MAG: small subunit ribosomal protein S3 [Fusobacteriota bacterium]KAF0228052.1 MAG: small subunit ribosomal protein [Fusobacteriota bacterium]
MGQKVHPKSIRLGITQDWNAKWFGNNKDYQNFFLEDVKIREFVKKKLYHAGISHIDIERVGNRITIIIHTGKPGIVIGRGGSEIDNLRVALKGITKNQVNIKVIEVKKPEIEAQLVAENIALQLEKRVSFRKAVKQSVQKAMKFGAGGIKVAVSGRLGGAEIARTEWYSEGKVPLHTLRANVVYATAEADTTYGKIGVKTWVYLGEVLPTRKKRVEKEDE